MGMPATAGVERRSREHAADIRSLVIRALMGRATSKKCDAPIVADRCSPVKGEKPMVPDWCLSKSRPQVGREALARSNDRGACSEQRRRALRPLRVATEHQVGIPHHASVADEPSVTELGIAAEKAAHDPILIPVMDNARVGEEVGRPIRARVARHHIEPDGVDDELSPWVFLKQFRLHPPGAGYANRSGRREQEDHAHVAGIGVEAGLEGIEARHVRQRRRLGWENQRCGNGNHRYEPGEEQRAHSEPMYQIPEGVKSGAESGSCMVKTGARPARPVPSW